MKITSLRCRWVLDSRGDPTIEVDVTLRGGGFGRASVPSGASFARAEASQLRDGVRPFGGMGVSRALNGIEYVIKPKILGMNADDQERIDATLCAIDGTNSKKNLGSNAILAVSLAVAKAAANQHATPFYRYIAHLAGHRNLGIPMPLVNIVNGGMHAAQGSDMQEIMLLPVGAYDIQTAIRMSTEIFHQFKKILMRNAVTIGYGDEGGFSLSKQTKTRRSLDYVLAAVAAAGYKPGQDVVVGIDMAASRLYKEGRYRLASEHAELTSADLFDWYSALVADYPIALIEDPFDQEAWADWTSFTDRNPKIQVVADDLIATNIRRFHKAQQQKSANTIVIKPSHIGTLTETIHAAVSAQRHGWHVIIAQRAAETEDATIAHLAVGLKAEQLKAGSVTRGERTAKYNELLRISESMKSGKLLSMGS